MPTHTVSHVGEHGLIARITERLAGASWVVVGPGDDAAVIEPERGSLDVITTDAHVDGVHFDQQFVPADAIGYRALAVNLSDLAAMGATPRAAVLSLGLPDALPVDVVDRIVDGVLALAARYRVAIVGGNVTRSPAMLFMDITAIGAVRRRRILTRAGARAGDHLYVTGTLGEAAVGLRMLRDGRSSGQTVALHADTASRCEARYQRPEPRVRAGTLLGRNNAATACIDLSDGLADGVRQLALASGVGIALDLEALPISQEARGWCGAHGVDATRMALGGGDDYELLFTVSPKRQGRLRAVRSLVGDLPITKIGVVTKSRELVVRAGNVVQELPPGGYEHFRH